MHYFVMVLVPADTEDVMQAVADLMEPFNHWKEVERSKRYLEDYEIQEMADHYGLSKIDLPALAHTCASIGKGRRAAWMNKDYL